MKRLPAVILSVVLCCSLAGCGTPAGGRGRPLPNPEPDEKAGFGIDKNINMTTIDAYLDRDDVVYRDMRMLFDPADYAAIGGEADLTRTIRGFKIVPYPYVASLSELPVSGAYSGECLYTVEWSESGEILSASPNYQESERILQELFPREGKAIFLMCGGGGYAEMMKKLLVYLGWDEKLLYNIGANWTYNGENRLELVVFPEDINDPPIYATWRADYAYIDFTRLNSCK